MNEKIEPKSLCEPLSNISRFLPEIENVNENDGHFIKKSDVSILLESVSPAGFYRAVNEDNSYKKGSLARRIHENKILPECAWFWHCMWWFLKTTKHASNSNVLHF